MPLAGFDKNQVIEALKEWYLKHHGIDMGTVTSARVLEEGTTPAVLIVYNNPAPKSEEP